MNRTMCPGQDTRYWRPDDIFNVACGTCGASIEFFRDDAARRCPKCGTRVRNPRLSTGCAQWCQHAKECLGYDPREAGGHDGAAARSAADSIVNAMKLEFGPEHDIVVRSVAAYETARGLIGGGEADPAVVFASTLLMFADETGEAIPRAERIMEEACIDRAARSAALDLIRAYRAGARDGSAELRIVTEAYGRVTQS